MIFLVGLNVFLDYLGFLTTAEANMVAIFETLRNSVLSLFKKQQTFNFNMGHGILHTSYKEAAKELMKRNMPEVLDNTQKQVIFLPETHLPKVPRVVDLQAYEPKKKCLRVEELAVLGMKKGTEDITNARGTSLRDVWQRNYENISPIGLWLFFKEAVSELQARAKGQFRSMTL